MAVKTRGQEMAREAFDRATRRAAGSDKERKEYRSFAREFPTLVHQCGLAQAVAFALAKKKEQATFVEDVAAVLKAARHERITDAKALDASARGAELPAYLLLSRDALLAAVWLKRYVEALFPDEKDKSEGVK